MSTRIDVTKLFKSIDAPILYSLASAYACAELYAACVTDIHQLTACSSDLNKNIASCVNSYPAVNERGNRNSFTIHVASCVRRGNHGCCQWNVSRIHGQLDELEETIG